MTWNWLVKDAGIDKRFKVRNMKDVFVDIAETEGLTRAQMANMLSTREDTLARRYAPGWRIAIWRAASLGVLLPWAGFVLLTATPVVWQSVVQFERFSDTGNPFYFVIKISAWLMALFMGLQALHDVFGRR